MKILLVDDHVLVREGLKATIGLMPGVSVVGEAANGPDALAFLAENVVDVVILDLSLPGRSGLDTLLRVKRDYPAMAVLVLSMHSEEQFGPRVIRAGASGYVSKNAGVDRLYAALEVSLQRGVNVPPRTATRCDWKTIAEAPASLHARLSDREFEILLLIGQGFEVKKIASQLGLRYKTIGVFRRRILEKLKMKTTAQLMHYAIIHRLVDQPLVVR